MNTNLFRSVAVAAGLCFTASAFTQTATVYLNKEKQLIRGFGGMTHQTWTGYDLSDDCLDKAFGNGDGQLGFSILRIWIDSDSNAWYKEVKTAKKVIDKYGGIVFATPWNPPTSIAETVNRNGRNEKRVKTDKYAEYAAHINKFNDYMKSQGAPLYALSYANEPDYGYDWTWWSADEIYNFTKYNAGSLRRNGVKVISHESFAYNKNYYNKVLNDASALKNIDILGTHFYASDAKTSDSFFQYQLADQKGLERWMTEHYTSSEAGPNGIDRANVWPEALDVAYEIHRAMVEGNFSAYVWWYIRRSYGPILQDNANTISKRGYLMGQFSKFVRPGYVRVDADKNPTYNVYLSAYKKDDDVVVVAVNRSTESKTLTISVPNTKVTTWQRYVTSGSKNLAHEKDVNAPNGSFQITLDAQSTTTFVGKGSPDKIVPTVKLTSPEEKASFVEGEPIVLSADASVEKGEITHVDFFANGDKLVEKWLTPRTFTWNDAAAGKYKVWAVAYDGEGNTAVTDTAYITVNVPQGPYNGTPATIPGVVEAEEFDLGGEGYAYHDLDEQNRNGGARKEGVDLNDVAVGYTQTDEWMEYTVNVQETGKYLVEATVASGNDDSSFQLYVDDVKVTDVMKVPNTGDWDTFTSIYDTINELSAGEHILKVVITSSWVDIDKFKFSLVDKPTSTITVSADGDAVVETTLLNAVGQKVADDAKGFLIEKRKMASGRVEYIKVMR